MHKNTRNIAVFALQQPRQLLCLFWFQVGSPPFFDEGYPLKNSINRLKMFCKPYFKRILNFFKMTMFLATTQNKADAEFTNCNKNKLLSGCRAGLWGDKFSKL